MFFLSGSKGISWHDRGDLATADYESAALTKDGAWHDMNISAIVGKGQKLVLIRGYLNDNAGGKKGQLKTKGYTHDFNVARCVTQVANKTCESNLWVYTDANGVIQYYFDTATWNAINLNIRGWFA